MEYLASQVVVHWRDKPENEGGKRVVGRVDQFGHVEIERDPELEKRELLEEWGVIEFRQVDAGPSFEPFLTKSWMRELASVVDATAGGWQRDASTDARLRRRARQLYPGSPGFRRAYMRGARARVSGWPRDFCPYARRPGWSWRSIWMRGWEDEDHRNSRK